jgi:hypothetical protein
MGNQVQMIRILSGDISFDCTWSIDTIPIYVSAGDIRIKRNTMPATLTIEKSTRIIFNGGGLFVGADNPYWMVGGLDVKGTALEPVLFTGATASPGSWKGIHFEQYSLDTINSIKHCVIEYGGLGGVSNNNITLNDCYADISHCKSTNSYRAGISCKNTAAPDIYNCLVYNNAYGIECDSASPDISFVTIDNNFYGVQCLNNAYPNITNTIIANSTNGINADVTLDTLRFNNFHNNTTNYNGVAPAGFGTLTSTNQNGTPCDLDSNIFVNPLYIGSGSADHSLSLSSFCIDAGNINADTTECENDIDGNPRWLFNYVDIGCYEFGSYWTGKNGSSWADSLNWSNYVIPGDSSKVIIPSSYNNPPIISTHQSCFGIEVTNGTTVEVNSSGGLEVLGK